jgi:hypothetical protein
MMIKYTFTILLIAFASCIHRSQGNYDVELKKFNYLCLGDSNTILLPVDFIGPKYFHYEEGAIAYFNAPDLSGVEILCGGCAELSCNKTYTITDTIKKGIDCYSVFYFDKLNKVYSRKLRTQNRIYMYENISTKRKAELDYVFDLIEKESKNNN